MLEIFWSPRIYVAGGALASGVRISPPDSLDESKRLDEEDSALFVGEDPKY